MKFRKSIYLSAAVMMLMGSLNISNAINPAELKDMKSKYIVVMDYDSGKVLYEKNSNQKIYPASTTKIWTAFCVLQKSKNLDELIKIDEMPLIEGTSMYLEKGESFTVRELLESLLIHSSNDVAYVLAKHFGDGYVSKFVDYMNEEAKKFGATNTHFNNPHGLPDTNHYTTAYDMVILSRTAYANDTIKNIVSMKSVTFKKSDRCKLDRIMYNSNKFLNSGQTIQYGGKDIPIKYDIVDGMKTGYTDDALNCLVSTAKKDGSRTIAGVFYAPGGSLYHDSRLVLDYSFENFKREKIFDSKDFSGEKSVRFASPSKIKYKLANDFSVVLNQDQNVSKKDYTTKLNFDKLDMPVKKGDVVGTMDIYKDGELISNIALISETNSKTYWQIIADKIPFLSSKDEEKENSSSDNDKKSDEENNNTGESETDKKADKTNSDKPETSNDKNNGSSDSSKPEDSNDKKENNKKGSNNDGILNKTKSFFSSIFHGIAGIFEGVSTLFKDITNGSTSNIEKLPFYKFLESKIKSVAPFIPAKLVILGVPILFILLIVLLILGIIIDSIKSSMQDRRERKANKKKRENKN